MANRYTPGNEQRRQQVQELTKQLEEGTKAVFESTRYEEYLRVMSKFPKYSVTTLRDKANLILERL